MSGRTTAGCEQFCSLFSLLWNQLVSLNFILNRGRILGKSLFIRRTYEFCGTLVENHGSSGRAVERLMFQIVLLFSWGSDKGYSRSYSWLPLGAVFSNCSSLIGRVMDQCIHMKPLQMGFGDSWCISEIDSFVIFPQGKSEIVGLHICNVLS